jgi:vesicle coat complex subunit
MIRLPTEIIEHIYSFDSRYHDLYNICIDEMKAKWKKEHDDYVIWRSHC